ncbi:hypothetical protein AYI68_g8109 [Smittium mucronatum]|uniref:Uncharacterized protein n=1 Tax=Smittium mucronatum TaxID=133383 RepID=A0A1R0GLT4_9FUNG|nr:hypothetical protein AYI68_g8109 [Smittium mucronatum]
MRMAMRKNELLESGTKPKEFTPEVDYWRKVTEDRHTGISVSISAEVIELGDDLDQSVNLAGEKMIEDLVSWLSPVIPTASAAQKINFVSAGSNEGSADKSIKGEMPALRSLFGEGSKWARNNAFSSITFICKIKVSKR